MELSFFLAQLIGLSLVIVALAGLVRPRLIIEAIRDFDQESFSTLAIGVMTIMAGLAVVISHNVWEGSWRSLVTIMGWGALLKGCTYLVAPDFLVGTGKAVMRDRSLTRALLVVVLLLGMYLAYKGFGF